MNIQEYISSGIIEAAALGIATKEESAELQQVAAQYPEVARIRDEYQQTLEKYASLHAVKPPDHLKDDIWELVNGGDEYNRDAGAHELRALVRPKSMARAHSALIPRYLVAASLVVLIGSIVGNLFLASQYRRSEDELVKTINEKADLVNEKNRAVSLQHQSEETLSGLIDPAVKSILLNGTGNHSYCKAVVYWNSNSKDVFLSLTDLPAAPAGKQYQLWAIIDGKPVDAGMYEYKNGLQVLKMKKIDHAQMFAITLENTGGSPAPTLDQMYVAGNV